MTAFVTDPRPSSTGKAVDLWARLYADTDPELTALAADLRISEAMRFHRTPTQNPYYLITPAERADALAAGAQALAALPAPGTVLTRPVLGSRIECEVSR